MIPSTIQSTQLTLTYVPNPRPAAGHGASGYFNLICKGDHVGVLSLVGAPPMEAVVGYDIRPRFRRQGLATLAVRILIANAPAFGLTGLQAQCRSDNLASRCVLEKTGFELNSSLPFRTDGAECPVRHMIYRRSLAKPCSSASGPGAASTKYPESLVS